MMNEERMKEKMPIWSTRVKVLSMFEILRNEVISSENYSIILFLLTAYKHGLIKSEVQKSHNLNYHLQFNVHSDKTLPNWFIKIYHWFAPIISSISVKGQESLLNELFTIDIHVLENNFPEIFDEALYRIAKSQGRFGGEFIQPVEITRFMCALAELPEKSNVYNPFAGVASFGVYLEKNQEYFGQEINFKIWALGALRLMAYGRQTELRFDNADSILEWPNLSEKFDLIVANPPFGMPLGQIYRNVENDYRNIEQFLIEKGIDSLNPKGKLIALLPQSILFRGVSEKRLREDLIKKDLIDTIVSLPGGLLLNTGIPLVIIVINRHKKIPGKVRFIDAKKFVEEKNLREKVLNDIDLRSIILSSNEDPDVVRIISNEQIKAEEYNLNVQRYFQKKINGVKLGEILELVRGQRSIFPENGKFIRFRDLKDDAIDFKLDISNVGRADFRRQINMISESCLLLAMRWRTLRPTFFEYKGEPIFRTQDILSFKVNESRVDIAYLINELHAEYVLEQVESYRLGSSIPFIRRDDLLEVVIKLPSLEEQRAKVQGIFELSDKVKSLQEERNALAHGKSVKQFNEFASLKHTLGRPRQNILDWTDNLLHFLKTKEVGFESLNQAFAEFYEIDMVSALKEIKRDVNFMTEVLEKGEGGFVLEEFEKQIIPLSDINNIISELSSNGFNFKIKKLLIKGEKLKDRGIFGNKILLKTLLDNLLTNAGKYGYEKKEAGNEVVIELTEVEDMLSVEVRNNGKPFPKNFDREKFITKYSTADTSSGTGLGGYDINRIATDFNNPDWKLLLNDDPIYPVKFKFQFPIKLIN